MSYPLPAFHFLVEWGGSRVGFSEVSGLDLELQVIEYREGSHPEYAALKMPGIPKYANVTLKRGVMASDNEFFDWIMTAKLNTIERRDVTIKLLNEAHEPTMVWRLSNAFPVRLEGPTLNATGNEVAIETLELAHEGIRIENE